VKLFIEAETERRLFYLDFISCSEGSFAAEKKNAHGCVLFSAKFILTILQP